MNISIKSGLAVCAVYLLAMGSVFADTAEVTIEMDGCLMYDEDLVVVSGDVHQVATSSENGNIKVSCSTDLEPTSTGRSVIYNFDNTGSLCGAMGSPTDDWHQVISRSGKAKLTCHYRAD
jgi:hypothetical protein